jgi:predicted TPR repeat methyltransferase
MRASDSLTPRYFEEIFAGDPDPWGFDSSAYEQAKYARTIKALEGRKYRRALEIGCASGTLSQRLSGLCDTLLAVDVSETALARAKARCAKDRSIRFERMQFPIETPSTSAFDLIVISEVAYYWSDADLETASLRIVDLLAQGGRLLLVHWIGETDYPQSGDEAVSALATGLGDRVEVEISERTSEYRLDLWVRTRP